MQDRRTFIKRSCTLCAGFVGLGTVVSQLSSCATLPVLKSDIADGMIAVPFSAFTEKNNIVIVRNAQLEFDIAVIKNSDTDYSAMEMKCTHQNNPVTITQSGFFCSAHGSAFDLKGNVTKEPAIDPLKKYKLEFKETSVIINVRS